MLNDLTLYQSLRDQMRPGDVIAFGGETLFSRAIKFLTRSSVSHVAVVFEAQDETDGRRRIQIAESTFVNDRSGVQFNPLSERLADYHGQAWWLPLSERSRLVLDPAALHKFLLSKDGQPYDFRGINAFLARPVPGWGQIPALHHGAVNRWFCSEYVVAGFRAGHLLHGLEADEVPPQTLCECAIYAKCVQLIGKPGTIRKFNTREPSRHHRE